MIGVRRGVTELEERALPSSAEEGWMRDQEKSRSNISSRRRGGVVQEILWTTPPRPLRSKEASRLLLDRRSPPLLRLRRGRAD